MVALVHPPFRQRGSTRPQREATFFWLVLLLDCKGWLNLVHFNEQQLFACLHPRSELSAQSCQPNERGKKKHL